MSGFHDHALHIALTTNPCKDRAKIYNAVPAFFKKHKDDFHSLTGLSYDNTELYLPIPYIIFGQFDCGFISVIDSYKFAQKLFDPFGSEIEENINYQIQVGAAHNIHNNKSILGFYEIMKTADEGLTMPFLMISNLKLNNGLLIGNGARFIEEVHRKISDTINEIEIKYILLNSYNYCELTIVAISNEVELLGDALQKIRELSLNDNAIDKSCLDTISVDSLYKDFDLNIAEIESAHCFVDTHSYFGISKKYFDQVNLANHDFFTSVEWHVKTGHFRSFQSKLKNTGNFVETYFKAGKTDYATLEKEPDKLKSNKMIYDKLLNNGSILDDIRKIKTSLRFKTKVQDDKISLENAPGPKNITKCLVKFQIGDIDTLNDTIKSLCLSRQMRMKILKVFHNYNTNILDSILYVYIIDFKKFLEKFRDDLFEYSKDKSSYWQGKKSRVKSVAYIEKKCNYYITAFEDGFLDRVLNNYNYENLHDFNMDFNASATQIISTYDTIIKMVAGKFNIKNKEKQPIYKSDHLLTRINENNTESNLISVNYNIHHLIDPALVIATLHKEIINSIVLRYFEKEKDHNKSGNLLTQINMLIKNISRSYSLVDLNGFDFMYFYSDAYVFWTTFYGNSELYWYWHWSLVLQNSTQYSSIGSMELSKLSEAMIRPMLILKYFDENFYKQKFLSPVRELDSDWNILHKSLNGIVSDLEKALKANENFDLKSNILGFLKSSFVALHQVTEAIKTINDRDANNNQIAWVRDKPQNANLQKFKFLEDLNLQFLNSNCHTSNILIENIIRQIWNMEKIKSDDPELKRFEVLAYDCLLKFKEFNGGSNSESFFHLLRRDYIRGTPISQFIQAKAIKDDDIEYIHAFIDPSGDFFIPDPKLFSKKMKMTHEIFYELWDIALKYKKKLFVKQ